MCGTAIAKPWIVKRLTESRFPFASSTLASYLRGKRYNREKQDRGDPVGNQNRIAQSSQNDNFEKKTHERLAAEYNVSPATITRDGQYAAVSKYLPIDGFHLIAIPRKTLGVLIVLRLNLLSITHPY